MINRLKQETKQYGMHGIVAKLVAEIVLEKPKTDSIESEGVFLYDQKVM